MESFLTDLRYAIRMLAKSRGFTAAAVTALALGIGANTAIFSVVNAVLLRPLPYHEPERIVRLYESNPGQNLLFFSVSPPNYLDWKTETRAFQRIEAFTREQELSLTGSGEPAQMLGSRLSAGVFPLLGVGPAVGRTFRPEEAQPGASRVVLVAHGLWQRRFGGDPRLLGRSLTLDGQGHTVIGIMPPGFSLPNNDAELWAPLSLDSASADRSNHFLRVLGRIRPHVSLEQAEAELRGIARRLEQEYPESNAGWPVFRPPFEKEPGDRQAASDETGCAASWLSRKRGSPSCSSSAAGC